MPQRYSEPRLSFLTVLRIWIGLIGISSVVNTIQCFVDSGFLREKLYSGISNNNGHNLLGRLFGLWTLLAALQRIVCAISIHNYGLYTLTLLSFVLTGVHFVSEVLIFHSMDWTFGVILQITITGMSVLLMAVGYYFVPFESPAVQSYRPNHETMDAIAAMHMMGMSKKMR